MKNTGLLVLLFFAAIFTSNAQISAGGGIAFGSESFMGLNLRGMYSINNEIDVQSGLNIFQVRKGTVIYGPFEHEERTSSVNFNINGHYNLDLVDDFIFYPIFGLDIIFTKRFVNDIKETRTYTGVNIGIGGSYEFITDLSAYFETKYILSQADQLVMTAGVVYRFTIVKDDDE